LQLVRQAALEPFTLQLGGGQQLADVVVQLAAQTMALVFLDLQQAVGQLLGLKLDGLSGSPVLQSDRDKDGQVQCQQR